MAKYKNSTVRKIPIHYVENQLAVNIGIGTITVAFKNTTVGRVINDELFHIATLGTVTLHRSDMLQVLISHKDRFIEMEVRFNPDEMKKKMKFGISESKYGTFYKVSFQNDNYKAKEQIPQIVESNTYMQSFEIHMEELEKSFADTNRFDAIKKDLNSLLSKRKMLNRMNNRINRLLKFLQTIHFSDDLDFKAWMIENLEVLRNLPNPHKETNPIVHFRIIRFYFSYFSKQEFEIEFGKSSRIDAEQDAIAFFGRMLGLKLPYRVVTPYGMLLKDWDGKRFNPHALEKVLSYLQLTPQEATKIDQTIQSTFFRQNKHLQLNEKSDLAVYGYIKVTSISMRKRREILTQQCVPKLGLQRTVDLLHGISRLHRRQKHAYLVYTSDLQYLQRYFGEEKVNWPRIVLE
ncbi:hypothetical protein EVJ30_04770 [Exiguobacterium sp. SH5S13]|uniref:hypothetical protein n=1 Tax=Exiguobacterium sp. SH5S13 TaxID=2510959 RepID=UPI00103C309D|nr:hypothetical protein [Exiguobacterium sp. SH5S13]TCI56203.1 hypothetical protein EVJ30_04770 [Exiguobacterium sp. SH5S13]